MIKSAEQFRNLNLSESMEIEEFFEESIVYEIPDSEQIVTELAKIFKDENSNYLENADDSTEITVISASTALKSLETVQAFLLQHENTKDQLKCANILEKKTLVQQSNLDQYFK